MDALVGDTAVPNHHRHHRGFAGPAGLLAALTMTVGRGADARVAARRTGVGDDDAVVDVGCGPGTAARHAARLGAHVVGVDPAAVMLRVARVLSWGRVRVRFVDGRAEQLPLPDDSATVLWSLASVHHWPDIEAGLIEARRVLAAGGRLLVLEKRTRAGARGLASHGWTADQAETFAQRCRDAGFVDVRVERHDTGRRAVVVVVARNGT